jgi:uncharacterized RDD family membrane protein YckC
VHPPKQRSIITPEHFTVAPGILGLPLAAPSRRAFAMAIDGILVLILVKAGGVFLGIAAVTLLFRASKPDPRTGSGRRAARTALRLVGAVLMFVVIMNAWGSIRKRFERRADTPPAAGAVDGAEQLDLDIAPSELPALAGSLFALRRADDSSAVANAAEAVLRTAKKGGASDEDLREARADLVNLMGERADQSDTAAIDAAIRSVAGAPRAFETAPLMRAYLAAVERNDTNAANAYRDTVKMAIAAGDISRLESRNRRFEARGDSLERELDEAQKAKGLRLFIAGFADDLGLGFGWAAVYFTAFLALWRGQTPGKRIAGVRVLRLDGKPLGWWISFERFGGYAASFSVGLMGFFQILWDRNRQGLHDKACETVVVRDSAQARART